MQCSLQTIIETLLSIFLHVTYCLTDFPNYV